MRRGAVALAHPPPAEVQAREIVIIHQVQEQVQEVAKGMQTMREILRVSRNMESPIGEI